MRQDRLELTLSDRFSCKGASDLLLSWLEQYLSGRPSAFSLPLTGSPFQQKVMQALLQIPFGATTSYRKLLSDKPQAARAIGQACGRNRFPLLIPCHRVIQSDGTLGGFAFDQEIKKRLLGFEGSVASS